jgi:hypothetical protein
MTDISSANLYQLELLQEVNITEIEKPKELIALFEQLRSLTVNLIRNAELAELEARAVSLGGELQFAHKVIPGSFVWIDADEDSAWCRVLAVEDEYPDTPNIRLLFGCADGGEEWVRRTAPLIIWTEGMDTPISESVAAWSGQNVPD